MVSNKIIPKFKYTVKDLNKKHPALTISKCNTDGYSILCPGTTKKQYINRKIVHMETLPDNPLLYDTYFFLRLRFPLREETMRNTSIVNYIGRISPKQVSMLENKLYRS